MLYVLNDQPLFCPDTLLTVHSLWWWVGKKDAIASWTSIAPPDQVIEWIQEEPLPPPLESSSSTQLFIVVQDARCIHDEHLFVALQSFTEKLDVRWILFTTSPALHDHAEWKRLMWFVHDQYLVLPRLKPLPSITSTSHAWKWNAHEKLDGKIVIFAPQKASQVQQQLYLSGLHEYNQRQYLFAHKMDKHHVLFAMAVQTVYGSISYWPPEVSIVITDQWNPKWFEDVSEIHLVDGIAFVEQIQELIDWCPSSTWIRFYNMEQHLLYLDWLERMLRIRSNTDDKSFFIETMRQHWSLHEKELMRIFLPSFLRSMIGQDIVDKHGEPTILHYRAPFYYLQPKASSSSSTSSASSSIVVDELPPSLLKKRKTHIVHQEEDDVLDELKKPCPTYFEEAIQALIPSDDALMLEIAHWMESIPWEVQFAWIQHVYRPSAKQWSSHLLKIRTYWMNRCVKTYRWNKVIILDNQHIVYLKLHQDELKWTMMTELQLRQFYEDWFPGPVPERVAFYNPETEMFELYVVPDLVEDYDIIFQMISDEVMNLVGGYNRAIEWIVRTVYAEDCYIYGEVLANKWNIKNLELYS